MVKLMFLTQKQSMRIAVVTILWLNSLVLLLPSLRTTVCTSFHRLLILINRPPFIYIIFNFILFYILISSTFSLRLNFYQKNPDTKSSSNSASITETKSKDDTWWCRIVDHDGEDDLRTAPFQAEADNVVGGGEDLKTASFEAPRAEELLTASSRAEVENDVKTASSEAPKGEVEVEEDDDTMDATWKAIMEAKGGPQLKKSNTWTSSRRGNLGEYNKVGELKRCHTLKKRDSGFDGGKGWRRMEAVVEHDELKKRADAFIARVAHDMRLQRLESDQRFLDTINRGL